MVYCYLHVVCVLLCQLNWKKLNLILFSSRKDPQYSFVNDKTRNYLCILKYCSDNFIMKCQIRFTWSWLRSGDLVIVLVKRWYIRFLTHLNTANIEMGWIFNQLSLFWPHEISVHIEKTKMAFFMHAILIWYFFGLAFSTNVINWISVENVDRISSHLSQIEYFHYINHNLLSSWL